MRSSALEEDVSRLVSWLLLEWTEIEIKLNYREMKKIKLQYSMLDHSHHILRLHTLPETESTKIIAQSMIELTVVSIQWLEHGRFNLMIITMQSQCND